MKQVQVLLPYALASVTVVVASAIALGTTLRPGPVGPGVPAASAQPTPATRPATTADARMAYWRAGADGVLELWVSDLSGDRRSRIARVGADTELSLTRWSPDGAAVAYAMRGVQIGVARLDGSSAALPLSMPAELRQAQGRIVSIEWSPDAKWIAATFHAGNESDVYVAEARPTAIWERVTRLGDAYAGVWIDADRLFVETYGGLIAVLDLRTKDLRPLTGIPATSPLVGRDGRVYFIGGRSAGGQVAGLPTTSGWVWSATIDGGELRRETDAEQRVARLFGLLADGRAVTGTPGTVYVAGTTLVPLVFAGLDPVRRVVASDDGRRVIGITESRILQIDAAKIPRAITPGAPLPAAAATTLLSGLRDADVWVARNAVALARSAATPPGGPSARLAFTLGRALWQTDPDGRVRMVLGEPTYFISTPRWSPSGERLAAVVTTGSPARVSVVVSGPSGTTRWEIPALSRSVEWSPDEKTFLVASPSRSGEWETQVHDAATGRLVERLAGRVVWGAGGRLVLSDGDLDPSASAIRTGQRLEIVEGSARRTITDARRLAASRLLRDSPGVTSPTAISQVMVLGDPAHVGLVLSHVPPPGGTFTTTMVVVRVSDGEPIWSSVSDPRGGPSDVTPSPVGHLIGWTVVSDQVTFSRDPVVVDPIANSTTVFGAGRFAGWSPDGQWVYVARDEGLFAWPLAGGDPVRINSFGVPVVAARP